MKPKTQTLSKSKDVAKRPLHRFVMPCFARCPKCGSMDIYRHHRRAGEKWDEGEEGATPVSEYINFIDRWHRQATQECITHHCRTCGFDWQTPCLKKRA